MAERKLLHEIWEEIGEEGESLPMCCFAGPRGDDARRLLGPNARLLTTFQAGSHFEAMTIYNRFLKREEYTSDQKWDHQPYPDEWFGEHETEA